MDVLTGSGEGYTHQFLLHVFPYHPLHLCIHLPLPLPHNISTPHASLPLYHYLCTTNAPL